MISGAKSPSVEIEASRRRLRRDDLTDPGVMRHRGRYARRTFRGIVAAPPRDDRAFPQPPAFVEAALVVGFCGPFSGSVTRDFPSTATVTGTFQTKLLIWQRFDPSLQTKAESKSLRSKASPAEAGLASG